MLSSKEWANIQALARSCCALPFLPFRWDGTTKTLRSTRSKWKLCFCALCSCVTLANAIFLGVTLLEAYLTLDNKLNEGPGPNNDKKFPVGDLVMHGMTFMWYSTVWLNQVNMLVSRRAIASLFNGILSLNFSQGKKYVGSKFSEPNPRHWLIKGFAAIVAVIAISWTSLFVTQRRKRFFVYSCLVPVTEQNDPKWICVFAVLEMAFFLQYVPLVQLIICTINHMYLFSFSFWIKQISINWPLSVCSPTSTRRDGKGRLKGALETFRCLSLVNKTYNDCFARFVLPEYKCLCVSSAVLSSFAGIRFGHVVSPFLLSMFSGIGLAAAMQLMGITVLGSKFHEYSHQFSPAWLWPIHQVSGEDWRTKKFFRAIVLSCSPFGFQVGFFYTIKKITSLTVIHLVFNGTLCLLISH